MTLLGPSQPTVEDAPLHFYCQSNQTAYRSEDFSLRLVGRLTANFLLLGDLTDHVASWNVRDLIAPGWHMKMIDFLSIKARDGNFSILFFPRSVEGL